MIEIQTIEGGYKEVSPQEGTTFNNKRDVNLSQISMTSSTKKTIQT